MKLTPTSKSNNIAMHCKSSVGCGNPFRKGDNTPQSLAVFLCPSFFHGSLLSRVIHIMMVLFERPLRSVVPFRGITTSFNTITNTVVSISGGYPTQRKGITA